MQMDTLAKKSLLIVDDHNFSRVTVLRTLKNMGDPRTYSATHGMEALDVLEERAKIIDCVIADFNMPVMHGLQLVKAIRCGERGIPPSMPVIMLTAHGDSNLVQLALSLDVNGFILKPATVDALKKRLSHALAEGKKSHEWLKSVSIYTEIDVDSDIEGLLEFKQLPDMAAASREVTLDKPVLCAFQDLRAGLVLARPLATNSGQIMVNAGQRISSESIEKLKNLNEIGVQLADIWIKDPNLRK